MRRRPFPTAVLWLAIVLLAALLIAWLARFRVATAIVDRRLAAAHVPASYRITRIGPFLERMENVRLGDPRAPDLVARRIDVAIGYDLSGPMVRGITADGIRVRGRYGDHGLSFGALDRLLPSSGGKSGLPDIELTLRDAELTLASPAGDIRAVIAGEGNPARGFHGKARVAALALSMSGCVARDIAAILKITSEKGRPGATGPVRLSRLECPGRGLAVGGGVAEIALLSDESFEHVALDANYAGFGGSAGPIGFAGISGALSGSHSSSGYGAVVRLAVRSLSAPAWAHAVAAQAGMAAATPLGPVVDKAAGALAQLLRRNDATANLSIDLPAGKQPEYRLHRLVLTGRSRSQLVATENGGIAWTGAGLRTDADVITGGGDLPALTARLRQASAGAPLTGMVQLKPYAAGAARLAATPLRFAWDGARASFATDLTIDGPFDGGYVRGLTVPVRGVATRAGALTLDQGCHVVAFQRLDLNSFRFDPAAFSICGSPIVARTGGALRVDASTVPVRLTGQTSGDTPIALTAARVRLAQQGFAAEQVAAILGGQAQPTRLAIAVLDGTFRAGTIGGRFAGASGAIANVPLDIADAQGGWTMAGSDLRITGRLGVRDAGASERFKPLVTDNAVLGLHGGQITASAMLREPETNIAIAAVRLQHELASGTGYAMIDVPGITFRLKGLQPERLTPLTLGVIANVAGTVSGSGRIDWNAKGVASSGTFGTERIDLAAAFGPVAGIKGRVHFTDLLGLVSAPRQEATIAEVNPGVSVTGGVVHYQLIGQNRIAVEDARWPFAGGALLLESSLLDFSGAAERHLTFRIEGLDAAAFIQQLDFPNINATGTFDGALPMIFDAGGGRIDGGTIRARGPGTLAYVGELSNAQLGTMGKLAFDALKAIRYSSLDISLDGRLDGEMVSRVRFLGVREATPDQSLVTRLIRNLPFRFNIAIRAPFRGLVGSARAYMDPRLILNQAQAPVPPKPIQPPASGAVR
ncbi:MAG TPA: YdbH domain-containing protein [Sphingomonas sp.]|nr:YdbH domain-containing protein [Sphingomonas sp.]